MSRWNAEFSIGGGGSNRTVIDERIYTGRGEIIEEKIIRVPRREVIEERVIVGPGRREVIEERVIIDRPQEAYYGWVPPSHCKGVVTWVDCSNGMVPSDGVHAGRDRDNTVIYAGRAWHEGDLLPAKVIPSHGCAYVSWGGNEIRKHNYEVMCCNHVAWQDSANGSVPEAAIACGHTSNGERLYLGRRMHEGALTVGKVHTSHGCIYIPFDGEEISYPDYEVAVLL